MEIISLNKNWLVKELDSDNDYQKVNVPYASEKGPLFGKERALNEIKNTTAETAVFTVGTSKHYRGQSISEIEQQ